MEIEACSERLYEINQMISIKNQLQNAIDFFKLQNKNINNFVITQLQNTISTIDKKLLSECPHEYVEDYIDTSPTRSMKITYCRNCYSTFST